MPVVEAGPVFDFLKDHVFSKNVTFLYDNYQSWVDFIVYMLIFTALIFGVLNERFGKTQTKVIGLALGFGLSFSLVRYMPGLVGKLGPIAFLIFIALCFYLIFASLKKGFESKLFAMSLAYILSFFILMLLDPEDKLKNLLGGSKFLEGVMEILTWIFVFALLVVLGTVIYKALRGHFSGSDSDGGSSESSSGDSSGGSSGGGEGIGSWIDTHKWWGGKKPAHPKKITKRLKQIAKSDDFEVDQIEDALKLYKDFKKSEESLSEEEKAKILSKIAEAVTRVAQTDPAEQMEGLIDERLAEMAQLKQMLNPEAMSVNGMPIKRFINSLQNLPDDSKRELNSLIAQMGERNRQLTTHERTLLAFKKVYDERGKQLTSILQQTIVDVNTGNTSNLKRNLENLLTIKKYLAETDKQISTQLNSPDLIYLLEDIKNIYGPEDEIEDQSQRVLNLNHIINTIVGENSINKLIQSINEFAQSSTDEKTFDNFIMWLATARGMRDAEQIQQNFRMSIDDMQNVFNNRVRGGNGQPAQPQIEQVPLTGSQPIEKRDPKELAAAARNYKRNFSPIDYTFNGFVDELVKDGHGEDIEEIFSTYGIDEATLGRIYQVAVGVQPEAYVSREVIGVAEPEDSLTSLQEYIETYRKWFTMINEQYDLGKDLTEDLRDGRNLLNKAAKILRSKTLTDDQRAEANTLVSKAAEITKEMAEDIGL
ncbi:MAG: hypothetical protein CMH64_02205 [Nanoarchaeota archaeon]|nr:hypothetical protein [Nanoarchaeota archaeon]